MMSVLKPKFILNQPLFYPVILPIIGATLLFFGASSLRHLLFQSNALDLGWFDQAIYLISQGQEPIISFRGFHILGDHASLIVYPLALFYKIFPSVYWLLLLQAIALALGALPTWQLAKQAGLNVLQAQAMVWIYLLYPLVFNINLFDFHPEVFALPALLWLAWAARGNYPKTFILALILTLSTKAVLSLTVIFVGIWLFIVEKKRLYGAIALASGIAWFLIATKVIIPQFSGGEAAAVARYDFLGNSVGEIALNLVLKPQIWLGRLLTGENFGYLLLLFAPVIWAISWPALLHLIPALPALGLNLLTDYSPQKDLTHQYALPILPFLILTAIATLAQASRPWLKPQWLITWSIIGFLALAKYPYFFGQYWQNWDNLAAMQTAVQKVTTPDSLLTSPQIAPHLSQRVNLQLAIKDAEPINPAPFTYILLNTRHPGWENSTETVKNLVYQLQQNPSFTLDYQQDDIYLFKRLKS
jgi:uncharacterized membrane protein